MSLPSTHLTAACYLAAMLLAVCCEMVRGDEAPFTSAERSHWSLQPRTRPEVPAPHTAAGRQWVRNPIDNFILAGLEDTKLQPAPEADRRTLARRLSFDLTGLPPGPQEVDRFVADTSRDAYQRLVDRLLGSPRYGERWAQHWLDVVRFAETEGFEYDRHRSGAWRFRDYVIRSLNDDKPYHRFITEQLAGDELADETPDDRELLIAAGFHRLGPVRRNAGNAAVAFSRNEVLTERTDIIGAALLGVTVGCARCHDHEYDPVRQSDYYRLQAYLAATREHDVPLVPQAEYDAWKKRADETQAQLKTLKKKLDDLEGPKRGRKLQAEIDELEDNLPPGPAVISTVRNVAGRDAVIRVLQRGDPEQPGPAVGMRPLSVLIDTDVPELPPETRAPRTRLAHWITAADHPLTARVIVNRVWRYHFGHGIVDTTNDFGAAGDMPSHPQLLDWLANWFVDGGWRLKPLHRLIVTSATYRQSSRPRDREASTSQDPDNRLLSHFSRRRLDAEQLRDTLLSVAGELNGQMGGPSVIAPVDPQLVGLLYKPSQWEVTPEARQHDRRAIYLIAKRNLQLPFMEVFDQPGRQTSCARRESSTHSPQALELLNGPLANRLAKAFAARLRREAGSDPSSQVRLAFLLAAGREPTERESAAAVRFLGDGSLEEFALAVINLNAVVYVE